MARPQSVDRPEPGVPEPTIQDADHTRVTTADRALYVGDSEAATTLTVRL
jgi:hypothetical protein